MEGLWWWVTPGEWPVQYKRRQRLEHGRPLPSALGTVRTFPQHRRISSARKNESHPRGSRSPALNIRLCCSQAGVTEAFLTMTIFSFGFWEVGAWKSQRLEETKRKRKWPRAPRTPSALAHPSPLQRSEQCTRWIVLM